MVRSFWFIGPTFLLSAGVPPTDVVDAHERSRLPNCRTIQQLVKSQRAPVPGERRQAAGVMRA
jgi:hypothetical protein